MQLWKPYDVSSASDSLEESKSSEFEQKKRRITPKEIGLLMSISPDTVDLKTYCDAVVETTVKEQGDVAIYVLSKSL